MVCRTKRSYKVSKHASTQLLPLQRASDQLLKSQVLFAEQQRKEAVVTACKLPAIKETQVKPQSLLQKKGLSRVSSFAIPEKVVDEALLLDKHSLDSKDSSISSDHVGDKKKGPFKIKNKMLASISQRKLLRVQSECQINRMPNLAGTIDNNQITKRDAPPKLTTGLNVDSSAQVLTKLATAKPNHQSFAPQESSTHFQTLILAKSETPNKMASRYEIPSNIKEFRPKQKSSALVKSFKKVCFAKNLYI